MEAQINEKSELILDYMLNVPTVFNYDELISFMNMLTPATYEEIKGEWDSLCNSGVIIQEGYQYSINSTCLEEVKNFLSQSLTLRRVNADDIGNHIYAEISNNPEKQREYVALMGNVHTSDNVKDISFSDYEWKSGLGQLCDDLVGLRIMFLRTSASKKHSYRFYSLRQWPFDSYETLSNILLKHLKIEGLSDNEWRILFRLLFSRDASLPYKILRQSLDMTEAELRECVSSLKEKGNLVEKYDVVSLVQGVYLPILQYFKENIYQRFKNETVTKIKRKITEGLSNLYPLMLAKSINELPIGDTKYDIISVKVVKKSELPQPEQVTDLTRLGVALDLGDYIVLIIDVIREIENWVKGSLNFSLVVIPANDSHYAHSVISEIFSKCEAYLKIQDPYIGEDTFRIISSYVSKNIEVSLLTGLKLGQGEDAEDICRYIEHLKSERKGKFQIMFIGDKAQEAPFHDRFIISKTRCWAVGTSLKQIGKGKDTTIVEVPLLEKDEKIEPAFNWNWSAKKTALEAKGLTRMDYYQWKATLES